MDDVSVVQLTTADTWSNSDGSYQWSDDGNWSNGTQSPGYGVQAAITAGGEPYIYSNVTLDDVSLQNGGTITVTSGAILTLDDGTTVSGGTVTIGSEYSAGTLDVEHGASGPNYGATLDGVSVNDNQAFDVGDVSSGAILTLDDGTTIAGSGTGTLTISSGNTLNVEAGANGPPYGAAFDDVQVTLHGAVDVGDVNSGSILTLDDGTTITGGDGGTLTVNSGNQLDIETGAGGSGYGATFDNLAVDNNGTVEVDLMHSGAVLTLEGDTAITGSGTVTNDGSIVAASGSIDIAEAVNGSGFSRSPLARRSSSTAPSLPVKPWRSIRMSPRSRSPIRRISTRASAGLSSATPSIC